MALIIAAGMLLSALLTGCSQATQTLEFASELTLYNWEGDLPESVLEAFTEETGIEIIYETYESQEEAIENMRAGKKYDVVVIENRMIPILIREGLLTRLNHANLENYKYVSPSFRELIYDPGNEFSMPYNWGTTALVARSDLTPMPTSWSDLWDPVYASKVGIWEGQYREVIGLTLKTLGESANSAKPETLELVVERLRKLKANIKFLEEYGLETAEPAFSGGEVVLAMGYAGDVIACEEAGLDVVYIYPTEGALLWGDNFVIPNNSPNPATAELFVNFLMRPDMNARIANENFYATANTEALKLIDPQILNNPAIFPPEEVLAEAEIVMPLDAATQAIYDNIWNRFLNTAP